MKGGIVEPEKMAVARQRLDKHIFAATDTHETTDDLLETMFPMRFVPPLHSEGPGPSGWTILESETVKYGHESHVTLARK
jgi:hypothetical protein